MITIENIVFQECFEFCGIPASATIVHEVDNGGADGIVMVLRILLLVF